MAKFKKAIFSDFSGGMNLRNSADRVDDNQFQELINMSSEGNKLINISGVTTLLQLTGTNVAGSIQGIKLFSNYLICIFKGDLYVYNINTGVKTIQASAVTSTSDKYQIVVNKLLDIAIVLINTNPETVEDIKAYEFNITALTFAPQTFLGLTDKNFKCGEFYESKLLLGGNPAAPSVLYFSKTFIATSISNIYDFSAYNSGSQPVGDGEAIIAFASNNTEFFIVKTNSIWKIVQAVDASPSYAYQLRQETATGVINPFCIVNVEKDIIYFDGTTFRRISYEQNIQALSDSAIGKDIEDGILGLSQNQKKNAFIVYAYPYVKLILKSNTSSANDFAILYNVVDKGFSIQNSIDGNAGTNGIYNNKKIAYMGSQFDSTIYIDNTGMSINDGDMNFSAKSKKVNFGDGVNYKTFNEIEFNGFITIGLEASVKVIVDGKDIITKTINSNASTSLSPTFGSTTFGVATMGGNGSNSKTTLTSFRVKIPLYNKGREIEYLITGKGQGIFELNGNSISYKHEKAYDIH